VTGPAGGGCAAGCIDTLLDSSYWGKVEVGFVGKVIIWEGGLLMPTFGSASDLLWHLLTIFEWLAYGWLSPQHPLGQIYFCTLQDDRAAQMLQ